MVQHKCVISVITPVYNGERFIEECLKNVISQACPFVEHIIVDGGSSDKTREILERYRRDHAHIVWISEKDQGQSDAMNKGIRLARGKVIGVLNVDDFYEPGVLVRVVNILQSLPEPSFICGNCNYWGDEGKFLSVNRPKRLKFRELLMGEDINPLPVNPSAYFYHKSIHDMVGMYDLKEEYTLDLDFIFRIVRVARVRYFNETWGNFRLIKGTKTVGLIESGKMNIAMDAVFKRYRDQLFWADRVCVLLWSHIIRYFGKYCIRFVFRIKQILSRKEA